MTAPHTPHAGVTRAHLENIERRLRIRQAAAQSSPYLDDDTFSAQAAADLDTLLRLVHAQDDELVALRAAFEQPRPMIEDVIDTIEGQHVHAKRPKVRSYRPGHRRSPMHTLLRQVKDAFNDHFRS